MDKKEFRIKEKYKYNRKNPFLWILSHLLRYSLLPVILIIASIINNFAYGSIQINIGEAFNRLIQTDWKLNALFFPAIFIIVAAMTQAGTGLLRNFLFEYLAQKIEKNSREELYINLLGKSQTFHSKQKIGDIMARATNDVRNLNLMFNPGLLLIIDATLAFIIPLVLIGFIHPQLLIGPSIFGIFLVLTVWEYNKRLKPVSFKQREQFGKMNSHLTEAIEGIEVVKSNVQENYEWSKFTQNASVFKDYFIKQGIIQAKYWPMLVFAFFWGCAFLHGLFLWKNGNILLGDVIKFISLFGTFRFTTFISLFSFNLVQLGHASAHRILKLINTKNELDENRAGITKEIQGEVTFKNVSFNFENNKVLDNISFHIKSGWTVAIVGQTGSGKTTLTRLINRIFDTTYGAVLIDNIDVRDWKLKDLRSQISFIEQDIFLFSRSIRENIAFGREDTKFEDIVSCAKQAQAHNFILKFKDGYDTLIGERGVTLSGGQKQRIAIARALLTDPRILILDDSTSAIDSATEDEIQKAIKNVSTSRTTFIITHRLSQIRYSDKILVLKKGRLDDYGNHKELIRRSSVYQRIFLRGNYKFS